MPTYPRLTQRPEAFRLNPASPLARALVFAGLGKHHGGTSYAEDARNNQGTLNSFAGGNVPPVAWKNRYGRWGVGSTTDGGTGSTISFPSNPVPTFGDLSISALIGVNAGGANRAAVGRGKDGFGSGWSIDLYVGTSGIVTFSVVFTGNGAAGYSTNSTVAAPAFPLVRHHTATIRQTTSGSTLTLYSGGRFDSSTSPNNYNLRTSTVGLHMFDGLSAFAKVQWVADFLVHTRILGPSEIEAIADVNNVDLRVGGVPLILPPRRSMWSGWTAPAAGGESTIALPAIQVAI